MHLQRVIVLVFSSALLVAIVCQFAFDVAIAGADWPQFRGPGGQGKAGEANLPTKWSAKRMILKSPNFHNVNSRKNERARVVPWLFDH